MYRKTASFHPNMKFESNCTYYAVQSHYDISFQDTEMRGKLINEEEVPVAFSLIGLHDITIDLNGATLLFHGLMIPFLIEDCRNVTLRNFTIDYSRSPYTQAEIVECDSQKLVFRICDGFPFKYKNGEFVPVYGEIESDMHNGDMIIQPFDKVTRAPAYQAEACLFLIGKDGCTRLKEAPQDVLRFSSEIRDDGCIIWHGQFPTTYQAGQLLEIIHEDRSTPGIYACDCKNTAVENVQMKKTAGFAIHSYFCEDFTIRRLVIKINDDSTELLSSNADCIHMIGLSGFLTVEDCILENMNDDAINVHGYFVPVKNVSEDKLIVSFDFPLAQPLIWHKIFRIGDELTVYDGQSILAKGTIKVKDIWYSDKDLSAVIQLDKAYPFIKEGDHLENHEAFPEITIRRCSTGRNRPRGFLLSSWKKTVVEDCHFYNSACAIQFTGDTTYWHESGSVSNVLIRNNVFENCGYCGAHASIEAVPQFVPSPEAPYYHHGIRIEDNIFISYLDAAVYLTYCSNVLYRNNLFITSRAYPRRASTERVVFRDSAEITIDDTEIEGFAY